MSKTPSSSASSVSGGTATGGIDGGTDVYGFTGEVLTLTVNSVVKAEIDFSERPLIERELDELKTGVGNSDQYTVIEQAIGEDDYTPELESASGKSRMYFSEGEFEPKDSEGKFLEFSYKNDGTVDAEINCLSFSPLNRDDIELVVSVENAMGHLADLYTNKKVVSEQEDGYVV